MKWQKEKPKEKGFYWVKYHEDEQIEVAYYEAGKKYDYVYLTGDSLDCSIEAKYVDEWYGPLVPPEIK